MSNKLNLVVHCGGNRVEREQVYATPTPAATPTWFPTPHGRLLDQIDRALDNCGLVVTNEAHALGHAKGSGQEGDRYFGLLQVERKPVLREAVTVGEADRIRTTPGMTVGEAARRLGEVTEAPKDYSWVLGVRNSHDQTFPAGLLLGAQVFVCDNLAFNGEVKLARKHTRYCDRDLPGLVSRGVGRLIEKWHSNDVRYDAYKVAELRDGEAHDLIVRAIDNGAISASQVPKVLTQYRTPNHPEFAEAKNVWRLFNAVTEVAKENSVFALPRRTEALHGLLDGFCGLALQN